MDENKFFEHIYDDIVELAKYTKPSNKDANKNFIKKYDDIGFYVICFEKKGSDKFDEIVDRVKKYKDIGDIYSNTSIEEFIKDILLDAGAYGISSNTKFRSHVKKAITNFNALISEWKFITPLEGIVYEKKRRIKCDGVEIGVLSENTEEYQSTLSTIRKFSVSEEEKQFLKEEFIENYMNNVCIFLTVYGENREAVSKGKEKATLFLDCFNYFVPSIVPRTHRCCVNIKGWDNKSISSSFLLCPNQKIHMNNSKEGSIHSLIIDVENYNLMKRFGLFDLFDLVQKTTFTLTKFEKQILLALKWFSNGVKTFDDTIAFISFVNTLEAIYNYSSSIEDRSISDKISEGVAFCLCSKFENRKNIRKLTKNIYSTRSDLVHGRRFEVNSDELKDVISIGQSSIYFMLKNRSKFKNMEEFNVSLIEKRLR